MHKHQALNLYGLRVKFERRNCHTVAPACDRILDVGQDRDTHTKRFRTPPAEMSKCRMSHQKGKGKGRYSVYSLVSTEALTRPSSPSRPVHTETISILWGIFQSNWQHIAHKL